MQNYTITTQKQVRALFWDAHPSLDKRKGWHGDYPTDTRYAFVDFVDCLARDGHISEALAQRVTL